MAQIETLLTNTFGDRLKLNVSMKAYTSIKIGGPASFLLEAESSDDIVMAHQLCRNNGIRFILLGGCSNLLISDEGLPGLVVINRSCLIDWRDDFYVRVDGGYNLDQLVLELSKRGWADLTFAAGIPGSVGGAIIGGAGAFGHLVHDYLVEAQTLSPNGELKSQTLKELGIGYRTSEARRRGDIILDVLMGPFKPVSESEKEALLQSVQQIKAERVVKHPGDDLPSAGSFFKNLPPAEPGGRRIAAGKYLDEVECKGLRVGDARVFDKHANIIVNYGNATATDVDKLATIMAQRVWERFSIQLEREVQSLS